LRELCAFCFILPFAVLVLVLLLSTDDLGLGLEHFGLGLGLGLDTAGLGLGLGIDTAGLGLGLGLGLDTDGLGLDTAGHGLGLGLEHFGLGLGLGTAGLDYKSATPEPARGAGYEYLWKDYRIEKAPKSRILVGYRSV